MTDVNKIIRDAIPLMGEAERRELGLDSEENVSVLISRLKVMLQAESGLGGVFSLDEETRRELTKLIKANPNNFDPVFKWIEEKGQSAYVDGYVTAQYVANLVTALP